MGKIGGEIVLAVIGGQDRCCRAAVSVQPHLIPSGILTFIPVSNPAALIPLQPQHIQVVVFFVLIQCIQSNINFQFIAGTIYRSYSSVGSVQLYAAFGKTRWEIVIILSLYNYFQPGLVTLFPFLVILIRLVCHFHIVDVICGRIRSNCDITVGITNLNL